MAIRPNRVAVRVSDSERDQIERLARLAGYQSVARFIRESVLGVSSVGVCLICQQSGRLALQASLTPKSPHLVAE